jgi:glycosyltransferase involved in cell wall biosynthesis
MAETPSTEAAGSRTWGDRTVAAVNACRFAVVEPIGVRIGRVRFDARYRVRGTRPLVSVCVPTYNRGRLLIERAVASVLAQTYEHLELIVVGDHCTDDTEALMAAVKDPRVRFVNLPARVRHYPATVENHWFVGGAVPANHAMTMARGEWIARVDDDDTWTADHLEVLLQAAEAGQYEFVSAQYVEERFGTRVMVDGMPALSEYYTRRRIPGAEQSAKIGGVSTWFYRTYLRFMRYNVDCYRKAWNRVNDADLSVRIFQAGVRMGFVPQVLAYVLPRPGEATVGLQAYKATAQDKLEQYKFD